MHVPGYNLPPISSTLESMCLAAATHPGNVMTTQQQVRSTSQEHQTKIFHKASPQCHQTPDVLQSAVLQGARRRGRAAAAAPLFMVATIATASVEASMAPNSAT